MLYSWIKFYRVLFKHICEHETPKSLADKGYKIFGEKLLYKDCDEKITKFEEVDPLTFIAMFNRQECYKTKKKYFKKSIELFNLSVSAPDDVNGIPSFSNFTAKFINGTTIKDLDTIPILWRFAKSVNRDDEAIDEELFNKIIQLKSVKLAKITQFLFIVRPQKYFPADKRSLKYALLNFYIKKKPKDNYASYKEYMQNLQDKYKGSSFEYSYEAYLYDINHGPSKEFNNKKIESENDFLQETEPVKKKELTDKQLDEIKNNNNPPKLKNGKNGNGYERNPHVRQAVLQLAHYKCELCGKETFETKNGHNYCEIHHIVPMRVQERYASKGINLDVCQNVIALCPTCHKKIHYGKNIKGILKQLYGMRKKELENKNIYITQEQLFACYD